MFGIFHETDNELLTSTFCNSLQFKYALAPFGAVIVILVVPLFWFMYDVMLPNVALKLLPLTLFVYVLLVVLYVVVQVNVNSSIVISLPSLLLYVALPLGVTVIVVSQGLMVGDEEGEEILHV